MVIWTKKPIMLGEKPASTREMWGTRQALRPMRCDHFDPHVRLYCPSQNLPSCHGDQALPTGFAHSQLLTGLQHHRAFALPFAKYLAHLIPFTISDRWMRERWKSILILLALFFVHWERSRPTAVHSTLNQCQSSKLNPPTPTKVSSRPKRTPISYLATFPTSTSVAFFQRKPQGADQRHQTSQEIWGSEVEGPAVPLHHQQLPKKTPRKPA
jgi:hypothetical protein